MKKAVKKSGLARNKPARKQVSGKTAPVKEEGVRKNAFSKFDKRVSVKEEDTRRKSFQKSALPTEEDVQKRSFKKSDSSKENPSGRSFAKRSSAPSTDKRTDLRKPSALKQDSENKKSFKKEDPSNEEGGTRLNKYLAHAGVASRRAADTLIMQGHVTVNDVVVQEMGYKVQEKDVVKFRGKPIQKVDKLVYYLLNKPRNVLSTSQDEKGRKTVIDIIASKVPERVYPIGRLDRNTSGLIILTNDGDLTKKLSHPSHKVPKVYQATLDNNLSLKDLETIRNGIELEDGVIKPDSMHFLENESKREVQIELHSGKNRIVRRIFEHMGYEVVKLDRVYYAGLTKKNLPRGFFRPLTKEEIRMLKHFI